MLNLFTFGGLRLSIHPDTRRMVPAGKWTLKRVEGGVRNDGERVSHSSFVPLRLRARVHIHTKAQWHEGGAHARHPGPRAGVWLFLLARGEGRWTPDQEPGGAG